MIFGAETGNVDEAMLKALDALAADVTREVAAQKLFFKTITIKVRYENFETHTRSKTLPFMTNRLQDLQKTARDLLRSYLLSDRKIRLIGVRASSLIRGEKQKTLL